MPALTTRRAQGALLGIASGGTAALVFVGRGAPPVAFIALVVGTFAAYAALIAGLTKCQALGARTLIGACVALMVIAIAVPARSSRDVWAYVMYGRIVAQHHASPYTHVPSDFPSDPALLRVQPAFRDTGSVYGPVFTIVSAAGMEVCGNSPICGRVFFQTLEALAVIGAAWIVLRATRSWAAAACVGLNPVLIASIVNGAHNDGLVAVALLGAVMIARARPVTAGVLLGVASLVKVNALLPAGVLILWLLIREARRTALLAGATTAVVVVAGYLAAGGARALRPLQHTADFVSHHSFWYTIERWTISGLERHGRTPARAIDYAAHLIPRLGLIVVVVLALAIAAGRLRARDPVPAVAAGLAVYVLASPYILPWYAAPLIPLLAMRWRSKSAWVMLTYSALLFLAYPARRPPHPTLDQNLLPTTARTILPVVELTLLALMAIVAWRRRLFSPGAGEGPARTPPSGLQPEPRAAL
ncbi:MAG TPA: glycosyltransferase family 87 protein, partial [Actinomycetota bacterium]|nr:glycosyltransferase family 87 protein [Actinomycetota bacterium]